MRNIRLSKLLLQALVAPLILIGSTSCKPRLSEPPIEQPLPPPRQSDVFEKFFVEWLERHGEKSVIADERGVGLSGNGLRLRAATYDVKKDPKGASVELEFRISLPGQSEIVEYLAGVGESEDQATKDCLLNFVLTTFHTVYKAFMNKDDPHQSTHKVSFDGREREIFQGDLYTRGEIDDEGMKKMSELILALISQQHFDTRPHWIKVVYAQHQKKLMLVSVTLDNKDDASLTEKTKSLPWPSQDQFYMSKQFMVIK